MASTPTRVFLSYGHDEHVVLARRIKLDLEKIGFEVWMDEYGIQPTNDWQVAIEVGLEKTNSVIALMTPHSMRRPDGVCLDELAYARFRGKQIVPVMVKFVDPPLCISRLQWLDMQNWQDPSNGEIRESWYKTQFTTLVKAIKGELSLGFEGQQATLFHSLEPLDFGTEIEKHIQGFTGRKWFFDQFHSWLANKGNSRVFLLVADPGFGKSAISAMLAHSDPAVVGIHFCHYQDRLRSDPRRIMCTLAYQLSTQLSEYRSYLLEQKDLEHLLDNKFDNSLPSLFDLLFLRPLRSINSDSTLVFVIDALDELITEQGTLFLSLITDGFARLPEWFRLVVTSRPDPEIVRRMAPLEPFTLQSGSQSNINDLIQFSRERLNQMGHSPSSTALDVLVKRSGGNILYLKQILMEIQAGRLSIDNTESFPHGLSSVYTGFFERQFSDKTRYRQHVRPLLELVTAVETPLPIALASSILAWDEYELDDALTDLGGLFPVEGETIRPFHKSIVDWLVDPELSGRRFRISRKRAAEKILNKLWPEYERSNEGSISEHVHYLLPSLILIEDWKRLESILTDQRIPLQSTYAYVNRFPEEWDFTKLKKRVFDLNRITWDNASQGIPTDNRELLESFTIFIDIISQRTAPWFFELVRANSERPNMPAFFRSSFSDVKCCFHMNPLKVEVYYAVKYVVEKLVKMGVEVPEYVSVFLKELRKSSLFMNGSYLIKDDPDPNTLFLGFELAYRGDLIEDDPFFNTMSLKIELDQGGADPSFIKKLLSFGADATGTRKGVTLDLYAEKQGDTEVARVIREHLFCR